MRSLESSNSMESRWRVPGAGEGVRTRLGWGVWRDGKVLEMMAMVVTPQCECV